MRVALAPAEIYVGRVTDRDGARLHLDVHGLAHCGAGTGRVKRATRWRADGVVLLDEVCRRCLPALRHRLRAAAAAGDTYAADASYALSPPLTETARQARLDDIRQHVRASRMPAPGPAQVAGLDPYEYAAALMAELRGERPERLLLALAPAA